MDARHVECLESNGQTPQVRLLTGTGVEQVGGGVIELGRPGPPARQIVGAPVRGERGVQAVGQHNGVQQRAGDLDCLVGEGNCPAWLAGVGPDPGQRRCEPCLRGRVVDLDVHLMQPGREQAGPGLEALTPGQAEHGRGRRGQVPGGQCQVRRLVVTRYGVGSPTGRQQAVGPVEELADPVGHGRERLTSAACRRTVASSQSPQQ